MHSEQVQIRRAPLRRGQQGVDITVKSAKGPARAFAPSWDMVRGHQEGTLSDEEYTRRYLPILQAAPRETWEWLAKQAVGGQLTVRCFCRDGKFCHGHLLVSYATSTFPDLFVRTPDVPKRVRPKADLLGALDED